MVYGIIIYLTLVEFLVSLTLSLEELMGLRGRRCGTFYYIIIGWKFETIFFSWGLKVDGCKV